MRLMTRPKREQTSAESAYRHTRYVTLVGGAIDGLLGLLKIGIGLISHSQALIADGVHSLSDLITDLLVIIAAKHASREPDVEHPYGHGRIETMATVLLALSLIGVGLAIAWDAVGLHTTQLDNPQPTFVALVVAALSAMVKECLYRYTLNAGYRIGSELLVANAWHSRSDALSSLVVVVGVGLSLLGVQWGDAAAAVIVAVLICRIGWRIGQKGVLELIDTGVNQRQVSQIREKIMTIEGVTDVHQLRTRRMGGKVLADVHIHVAPRISVSEGHRIGDAVMLELTGLPISVSDMTVHIDPEDDLYEQPSAALPLRSDVEQMIISCLDELAEDCPLLKRLQPPEIALHYLSGHLEIELLFPLPVDALDLASTHDLKVRLETALTTLTHVRQARVLFG